MPKYSKNYKGVQYHVRCKGKSKRPYKVIASSTLPTSKFLAIVSAENPDMTIVQLRQLLLDKTKYLYNPEAVSVLDAHINAGYGDCVPTWEY